MSQFPTAVAASFGFFSGTDLSGTLNSKRPHVKKVFSKEHRQEFYFSFYHLAFVSLPFAEERGLLF